MDEGADKPAAPPPQPLAGNAMRLPEVLLKRETLLGALAAVLLIVGVYTYSQVVYHEELSEFTLSSTAGDDAGIPANASFTLTSSADLSVAVVQKHLEVVPEIKLNIEKRALAAKTVFEITPAEPLAENTVYSLAIQEGPIAAHTYSWAYQVKAPFQVISTLPRDKGNMVPTNTGIEITFNRENILSPQDSISISPSVTGKFEVHRGIVVFIPTKELEPETVYTVTVAPTLRAEGTSDALAQPVSFSFETGSGRAQRTPRPSFNFGKQFWEFKPETEGAFAVYSSNVPSASVSLAVYRLPGAREFMSAYRSTENAYFSWTRHKAYLPYTPPSEQKVFEATLPIEKQGYVQFLRLPQQLPEGYYLADVVVNNKHSQAWFQVTPIAGFSAVSGSRTFVWLKDIATGNNVSGAAVKFDDVSVARTGTDGAALFDTPTSLIRTSIADYGSSDPRHFFTAEMSGRTLVLPVENEYGSAQKITAPNEWWDYFSIDKGIYLPTDRLNFWGIIKERAGTDIRGEELTIELSNPYWSREEADVTVYAQTKAQIGDFYTLTGSLSFDNLRPGLYQLNVIRGDEVIVSENVNVETYVKPAYKITLTPEKNAVFAGDAVRFKVKAEFFDGTPMPNLALSVDGYYEGSPVDRSIVLDTQGEGSVTVDTSYEEDLEYSYWPRYLGVTVRPQQAEEGEISASAAVLVFGPSVHLKVAQKIQQRTSTFDLTVRNISLEKVLAGSPWWDSRNYLSTPASNQVVQVTVDEVVHHRTQVDTRYDIISKTTYPVYNYSVEYKQTRVDTLTTDVRGVVSYSYTPQSGNSYRIRFVTRDSQGRVAVQTRYAYGGSYSYYGKFDARGIQLKNLDEKAEYDLGEAINLEMQDNGGSTITEEADRFAYLRVNNGISSYVVSGSASLTESFGLGAIPNMQVLGVWWSGERFVNTYPLNLSLNTDERRLTVDVQKDKERYRPQETVRLSISVKDRFGLPKQAEVNVSGIDEAVFALNPEEKDITNVLYQDIFSQLMMRSSHYSPLLEGGGGAEKGCFAPGTKVLVPGGTKNIEDLRAGDTVLTWAEGSTSEFVEARVSRVSAHQVSGYLVINDRLRVSVNHRILVDGEWKLAGEIRLGDRLLRSDGDEVLVADISHVYEWGLVYNIELEKYHTYFADGILVHNEEKGGGGARSDFRDNAIYKSVRTDGSGQAEVSFTAPDNLTSWRVTTQAVSKDLFAGKSVSFVPVSLPFFVDATLNRTYLAGDLLTLRLRTFGTAEVTEGITYTVESETLPFKKVSATGGAEINIPLMGALPAGDHALTIRARGGGHEDAIVRNIKVLQSYFTEDVANHYELSDSLRDIAGPESGYATLYFTSLERARFYYALRFLTCDCGLRLDQKAARWFADSYLNQYFGDQRPLPPLDMSAYQTQEGGMSLLTYSDPDLELTAKFANLLGEESGFINRESLMRYLSRSLSDRKADLSRVVLALYGLSAMKEPVLTTLQNVSVAKGLTLKDKVYIALALNNLGAKEDARTYYRTQIAPQLSVREPYVYVSSLQGDDNVLLTVLLAGLTTSVADSHAEGLTRYALENYPRQTLKSFETLLFIKVALPATRGEDVSFAWRTASDSGTKTFESTEGYTLTLSAADLATLAFSDIRGRIGVVSSYEKVSSPSSITKDNALRIEREYYVDGNPTTQFSDGDLVEVVLTPQLGAGALSGTYQIVDYLPSGMRIMSDAYANRYRSRRFNAYLEEVNEQRVTFSVWDVGSPVSYYARVVSSGSYKAEPAMLQSLRSLGSLNLSPETTIIIK